MLIDFTVTNFRSIKDPVTLSMLAQKKGRKPPAKSTKRRVKPDDEIAQPFIIPGREIELLPVASIFGANASGKSNVIQALDVLLRFMWMGASFSERNRNLLSFTPFKLGAETSRSPSQFELRVAAEGIIYTYALSVNQQQIIHEKLEYIPAESKQLRNRLLFQRDWQAEEEKFEWKNGPDLGNAYREIQESLKHSEPFMAFLATRLKVEIVEPLTKWFRSRWLGVTLGWEGRDHELTTGILGEIVPQWQKAVTALMRRFDTGISDIEIEKVKTDEAVGSDQEYKVWVEHNAPDVDVKWPLEEESTGTQRLFSLVCKMLHSFSFGRLIIVDELGSNIHPNLAKEIVRLYQSSASNPKRAQLIFTSHDNTLQRGNLLRRDQVWFTQKRGDGSTDLYPLSDFHPRNDLAIDKAYLDGRFGAVPLLPSTEELMPTLER